MRRLFVLTIMLFGIFTVIPSCQKAPSLTLNGPRSFSFTNAGGSQSFSFSTNRDWRVSSSDSWCRVSPSSGSANDGQITASITCDPNTTYDSRSATVTIKVEELVETITVTQDTNYGFLVSPQSFDLTNAAQTVEVEVRANVNYTVEIDTACKGWISQTETKALSTEKIVFSIAANDTYDNREGKIYIKQTDGTLIETITVKQNQTNGLFITTPEYDLSNEEHYLSVEIKANVDYEISSSVDWIKCDLTETRALTSSTISLLIEANNTYDDREGKVTVKQTNGDLNGTITIRQDENNGIFVSEESATISKEAQTVVVTVKYNVDFDVVIPSYAQGSIITNISYSSEQTKALETRTYRFDISENNTYDERDVSVTFKQKDGPLSGTFRIIQAQTTGLLLSTKQVDLQPSGGSFSIKVSSNIPYDVSIQNASWIQQITTKGLTDEEKHFKYSANEGTADRKGTISFISEEYGIKEEVLVVQYGEGYHKGDVVLMSDSDLIDFNNHSIKVIDGDLIIKNTGGLTSLAINNRLQKVLGTIQIEGESVPITGLENLSYVHSIRLINCSFFSIFNELSELPGDFYYSYLEPNISNFEGLEWLTKIDGDLSIISPDLYNGFSKIVNFKGFDNLIEVKGNILINGFFAGLRSFDGFNKLKRIGSNLDIYSNGYGDFPQLRNFKGFDSLEQIGGHLLIGCGMRNVTSFAGLESLKYIGDYIGFRGNWGRGSLLSSLTSFQGLENLQVIGGCLYLSSGSGPVPISSFSALKSLRQLGGLYLGYGTNPSLDVESFTSLSISEIGGYGVLIGCDSIGDLFFLRNITSIKGGLHVFGNLLHNWKGLTNLKEVGQLVLGNGAMIFTTESSLSTTEGLSSIERIGTLYIGGQDVTDLSGLSGLKRIDDGLHINNTSLQTLDGLYGVESIGTNKVADGSSNWILYLYNNQFLSDYSGLHPALQYLLDNGIYNNINEISSNCFISGNKYNPSIKQILGVE